MQTKSGGALAPAPTTLPLTDGERGTVKEWKGVIEKIRGSILLFCREKRGRQEEASSYLNFLFR